MKGIWFAKILPVINEAKIFAYKRLNFECNKQCESLSWHVDTFNATATGYTDANGSSDHVVFNIYFLL